jgi:hypothetical protein
MTSTNKRLAAVTAVLALAAVLAGGSSQAAIYAPAFAGPQRLGTWLGGEPSIAFDPQGKMTYVVAPQGIPSLINVPNQTIDTLDAMGVFDQEDPDIVSVDPGSGVHPGRYGVGFWASTDGGATWKRSLNFGSLAGGGDTDVVVAPDRTVYVTDLQTLSAVICSSRDYGATFGSVAAVDGCQALPANQTGPIDDRPWLTVGRAGELYLTYHDIVTFMPIVLKSTDRGQTFTPCGSVIDPQGPLAKAYTPYGGTLVSKPVVGRDGTVFVTISVPDIADGVDADVNHLYVASAKGCSQTTVWKNVSIFHNARADLKLFQSMAIDGGGILYTIAAGRTASGQSGDNIWLFTSRDAGLHWSAPTRVNPPSHYSNAMPAIAGGLRGNQVAIGWYATSTSYNPDYLGNQWRYYAATSFDGGRTFKMATLTPGPVHYGAICSDGLSCVSGRNLADFSSIAVNPVTGCVVAVYGGDPWNKPAQDQDDALSAPYVSRQTGGTCLR